MGAALLLVRACGAWFGGQLVLVRGRRPPVSQASWDLPALILGASTPSRDLLELTTGLTSLANLAPVFFAVVSFRWTLGTPDEPVPMSLKTIGVALFLPVLFRAFAWSERLAVICCCAVCSSSDPISAPPT